MLTRAPSTDQGTFGIFALETGQEYYSLELPWDDNRRGESCIPAGIYTCKWINSPKHGGVYQVMDVPGRSMIEIHVANFGGDKDKGYKAEIEGCIALGRNIGIVQSQLALLSSRYAVMDFHATMREREFKLEIRWG